MWFHSTDPHNMSTPSEEQFQLAHNFLKNLKERSNINGNIAISGGHLKNENTGRSFVKTEAGFMGWVDELPWSNNEQLTIINKVNKFKEDQLKIKTAGLF